MRRRGSEKGVRRSREGEREETQIAPVARRGDSRRSHVPPRSHLDDPAPLRLHWEKGNGRRIYCWVLTCTHSWCCFSPLGPLAIPKASKTTGCQVVTAGFKQLLQQPCTQVPSLTMEPCVYTCICGRLYVRCVCVCVRRGCYVFVWSVHVDV